MAYQEPCCIARKLPALLREHEWYVFQTNGDVLVEHFMSACSSLVGEKHQLILAIPTLNINLLRVINHYFDRGWTTKVKIITHEDKSAMVKNELSAHISFVHYAYHKSVCEGLLAFIGEEETGCIIQGTMLTKMEPGHRQYFAYLGNNQEHISNILETIEARIRINSYETRLHRD